MTEASARCSSHDGAICRVLHRLCRKADPRTSVSKPQSTVVGSIARLREPWTLKGH